MYDEELMKHAIFKINEEKASINKLGKKEVNLPQQFEQYSRFPKSI